MSVVGLRKQHSDSPFSSDPVESFTILSRYYLDADIYEKEKEAIFIVTGGMQAIKASCWRAAVI